MSVMCHSAEFYGNIAATLIYLHATQDARNLYILSELMSPETSHKDKSDFLKHSHAEDIDTWLLDIVNDFCRSNTIAYNERYGKHEPIDRVYIKKAAPAWSHIELYKALHATRYNIIDREEESKGITGGTYARIERLMNALAHEIICELDEYKNAKTWGD